MMTVQLVDRISRWMSPKPKAKAKAKAKTEVTQIFSIVDDTPDHDEIMERAVAQQRAMSNRDCGCGK